MIMSDDPGAILKAACDAALANPAFQPKNGNTFCNFAVQSIANALGCHEFDGLMADEIYQTMAANASGRWTKVSGSDATIHALGGGLAVAGLPSQRLGEAHGHVAVLYPVGMQYSGSLKHDVPVVANVGKTVGAMRSSGAFPILDGEADYFTWNGQEA
jgi:hypothetical protein